MGRRRRGAGTAVAMWLPIAVLLFMFTDTRGTALAVAGSIACPVAGALIAPQAQRSAGWRTALMFAVVAMTVGTPLFGLAFAISERKSLGDSLGLGVVGLVFLGIPVLVMGMFLARVWVQLVRAAPSN